MRKKTICLLLAGAMLLAGLAACNSYPEPERLTTYAMGSVVQQTVYGEGGHTAAADAAQAVQELENTISWRVEGSDIARLNAAAGKDRVQVSMASTSGVLYQALEFCKTSGGALDITIGPVSRLWDFDGDPHVPDPEELAAALERVDYRKLTRTAESAFDGPTYYSLRDPGMALDLGAIGKGYACDEALRVYRQDIKTDDVPPWQRSSASGVTGAVIAVGGSVAVCGSKPDGEPWRIAVRDPKSEGTLGEIEMNSGYVSTSGSYEKTFTENGKAYHHILDPRTGYPAESGLVSVTVWMPSAEEIESWYYGLYGVPKTEEAREVLGIDIPTRPRYNGATTDALSTACFVLGLEDSLPLLEEFGAEAIFITEEDEVYVTDGMRDAFTLDRTKGYTLAEDLP